MQGAECPECAGQISPKEGLEAGELVSCHDCGTRLEVVSTSPFVIQPAPKIEEDWGE